MKKKSYYKRWKRETVIKHSLDVIGNYENLDYKYIASVYSYLLWKIGKWNEGLNKNEIAIDISELNISSAKKEELEKNSFPYSAFLGKLGKMPVELSDIFKNEKRWEQENNREADYPVDYYAIDNILDWRDE